LPAADTILSVDGLTREISKEGRSQTVVDGFTFDFQECKFYTVLGPSGAGKSSLLRLLNRLDEPTGGRVLYKGQDIRELPPPNLRCRIGYLFQTPHLFDGTVRDNIRFARSELSNEETDRLAEQCRIKPELVDRDVTHLSVGEKQRVALARLMATNPDVALLDEPTSALDPTNTDAVESLVRGLVDSCRLTVILVTHEPNQALRVGGEALLLVNGRLVEHGSAEDVIAHPRTEEARKYINRELA
jgi:putative ABC transport system ATP-binding protein